MRSVAVGELQQPRPPQPCFYLSTSKHHQHHVQKQLRQLMQMACERTFTEPWDLSDVTFVVEGRYIYANKTIMSMWSPVLKAMFGGGFRERDAAVVELPGKLYDDILELVCVLHPPNKPIDGKRDHDVSEDRSILSHRKNHR